MDNPLTLRTISSFPLSIGTALAFESVFASIDPPFDPEREIPNKVNINQYNEIYISLATLFRNISGAVTKEYLSYAKPEHFLEVLISEINVIYSLFESQSSGLCKPIFYYCSYEKFFKEKTHQAARFRLDSTPNQVHMTQMLIKTMQILFSENKHQDIRKLDSEIRPSKSSKALILTHIPYDLLNYRFFDRLDLLESHTGKLKARSLWYTKFYKLKDEELNTLPFYRKLLLIFGDNIMIQPMDIRFRKLILDISRKRKWTPFTTEDKILQDLNLDIHERYLFEMYRQI